MNKGLQMNAEDANWSTEDDHLLEMHEAHPNPPQWSTEDDLLLEIHKLDAAHPAMILVAFRKWLSEGGGISLNARRIAGRPDIAVVKVTSDDRATLGAPRDDIHGWVTLTSHENGWRIYGFGAFPSLEQLPPPESESAPRYDNDFETTLE